MTDQSTVGADPCVRPDTEENTNLNNKPTRPFEITRTELVWPGKYDEKGNLAEPPRVSLPFQVIEVIEEGRTSREALKQIALPLFGAKSKGPTEDGWRNKLIWGDNLLVEASLLKDFAEKIDLIYIDPPFATGLDFSVTTLVGDGEDEVVKGQSLIEEKAYRDTWARGYDSYLAMLYKRLLIARDLLSSNGTIYVHIGPNINHLVRSLLEDVLGVDSVQREIVWQRVTARSHGRFFPATHDCIFFCTKSENPTWNQQYTPVRQELIESHYSNIEEVTGRRYSLDNCLNQNKDRPNLHYEWHGHIRTWRWTQERMKELDASGRLIYTSSGMPRYKRYLDESTGVTLQSVWTDIRPVNSQASEDTGYPSRSSREGR